MVINIFKQIEKYVDKSFKKMYNVSKILYKMRGFKYEKN